RRDRRLVSDWSSDVCSSDLRVRAQNANALALARVLEKHPNVEGVNYPGLEKHPDHGHAARLLKGFGGMLSFRPKGGAAAAAALRSGERRGREEEKCGRDAII